MTAQVVSLIKRKFEGVTATGSGDEKVALEIARYLELERQAKAAQLANVADLTAWRGRRQSPRPLS